MWALRRASVHLRRQGLVLGTARVCCGKSDVTRYCLENSNVESLEPQEKQFDGLLSSTKLYTTSSSFSKSYREVRAFSSQAGVKSNGKDDDELEDGFSELETPHDVIQEATSEDENEDELFSRSESDEEGDPIDMLNELDAPDSESSAGEKKSLRTRAIPALTKAVLISPAASVGTVLDKWVEEGNEVTEDEASLTMFQLRTRRLFFKALQLSEWLESTKCVEFVERNYASRLDLIAKVRGIYKAEEYLKQIPESFRGEVVYRTLLANCVRVTNVKKSEEVFNKMRDLGFTITCFSCNQLLLLAKRTDKKKIADVLLLMEKENIKPNVFTYQVLVDVKGKANDISGMEQIVETMKNEGLEPTTQLQASLARHYAFAGLKEKAEAVLKEMEGADIKKNRGKCCLVLPLYALIGKEDEVNRIWKVCESDARWRECIAAIEAWGQLNKVNNAEEVFNKMLKKVKRLSAKHFSVMLKVYANHKMLTKGKDLVKRMEESKCTIGPVTWDALVKLYVGAGEVEKAASILEKAIKQKKGRPLFCSYLAILEKYAERGDVHNAEKIFLMMKQAGYASRLRQYQSLLQAYINAKAPAYGFSDRMRADNIFPNKTLAGQLARVDAFRKSAVAELLD